MKSILILLVLLLSCKTYKEFKLEDSCLLSKQILKEIYKDENVNLNAYTLIVNEKVLNRNIQLVKLITSLEADWYRDFEDYKNFNKYNFEKWSKLELDIQNLNISFPITKKEYLDEYKRLKGIGNLNDKELYLKKMQFWSTENKIYKITTISNALINNEKSKAILFTSTIKSGYVSWAFEKLNDKWILKEKKDILLY